MRIELVEWRKVFGEITVGRAYESDVNAISILGDLRENKIMLWNMVESKPTAGIIELRDESRLRKIYPKRFKGIVLRGIQGRDREDDYAFLASNFTRLGKSKSFKRILSLDNIEDRITAILNQKPRMELDLRVSSASNCREVLIQDMMNSHTFKNRSIEVNRRLLVGAGFSDGTDNPKRGVAFFENGRLLKETPSWLEDVFVDFRSISDDLFKNSMHDIFFREKLDYKGGLVWRPDMVVRYIVKTDPKAKFHVNVPSEYYRYCVLPDYCAVEFGEDIKIIDDPEIGNTLYLNLPRHECYHHQSEYVMLAELKD